MVKVGLDNDVVSVTLLLSTRRPHGDMKLIDGIMV